MKILIINGYDLQAEDWEKVIWGEKNRPGRCPMGLYTALQESVDRIVWNTGKTQKNGLSEAEYILQYAQDNLCRLADWFPAYFQSTDSVRLRDVLKEKSIIEKRSTNTLESIKILKDILEKEGITATSIIQVSSANHIARCLLDTQKIFQKEFSNSLLSISGVSAYTCYGDGTLDDINITETVDANPLARDILLGNATAMLNAERGMIWHRYNTMLVANSIVSVFLSATTEKIEPMFIFWASVGGLLLSACWFFITKEGWKYAKLYENCARNLWGLSPIMTNPFRLREDIEKSPRSEYPQSSIPRWHFMLYVALSVIFIFILYYISLIGYALYASGFRIIF
jgi:hypothetical protein